MGNIDDLRIEGDAPAAQPGYRDERRAVMDLDSRSLPFCAPIASSLYTMAFSSEVDAGPRQENASGKTSVDAPLGVDLDEPTVVNLA
jgi:hypothetical protein